VPEAALNRKKYEKNDTDRPMLARDIEAANGGAGVFNIDLKRTFKSQYIVLMFRELRIGQR
jgi:nucleolar GTP-binding protein